MRTSEYLGTIKDPRKIRDTKIRFALKDKEKAQRAAKNSASRFFALKETNNWVEEACGKCHKGMSKAIYDFQKENRPEGPRCSQCDKKEDIKDLKQNGI